MKPFYQDHLLTVYQADVMDGLRELSDCSVHCCVTSPPYWGLRDYGVDGQIGLEKTPEEYVAKMVAVFREVKRVLRDDGTLWLNLGDSYANSNPGSGGKCVLAGAGRAMTEARYHDHRRDVSSIKPKDLVGIPWRVAFALQADGWYLRSDIIWHKPNPMPESVTDRPTKAHEYIFLLSKNARYYYDAEAVKETAQYGYSETSDMYGQVRESSPTDDRGMQKRLCQEGNGGTRNKRTVWTVPSQAYPESHFATFPEALIKPCIMAGCHVGGTVLDPFGGSFTTAQVALELGRKAVIIEINPKYVKLGMERTHVTPSLPLA